MKRLTLAFAATLLALAAPPAAATGFTELGYDVLASTKARLDFHGVLRLRSELLHNLDLDRGPTPSGELFFPVSLSEPDRQTLFHADTRLRTDLAFYAPGGMVAVKARVDVLDNVSFGDSADGIPGGSLTQRPPGSAFIVKRAWGEAVTPLGYFAAGRMGAHWGLGMLSNGGDCADCDSGDAADRVTFATAALGHIFAVAYDFSAVGHDVARKDEVRTVDVEPSAAVRTFSLAILNWRNDASRERRTAAGKATFEYGLAWSHRWQDADIPASYLPLSVPVAIGPAQLIRRGLIADVADLWLRLETRHAHVELEAAYLHSEVDQASSLPGFEVPERVTSNQFGLALESTFGELDGSFDLGMDMGFASGDSAPGFGARPALQDLTAPVNGDLDGPQAVPPYDNTVDNFRFHPDYRVDRILFREIIGTVTDAFYLRPHARLRLATFHSARLDLGVAGVMSWANYASSTPGGHRALGLEIDPTLAYHADNGFAVQLEYAVLFPWAGLDNPAAGLIAKPAQLLRLHLAFGW